MMEDQFLFHYNDLVWLLGCHQKRFFFSKILRCYGLQVVIGQLNWHTFHGFVFFDKYERNGREMFEVGWLWIRLRRVDCRYCQYSWGARIWAFLVGLKPNFLFLADSRSPTSLFISCSLFLSAARFRVNNSAKTTQFSLCSRQCGRQQHAIARNYLQGLSFFFASLCFPL